MSRGSLVHVAVGTWLADAAYPPGGWWDDFPGMGRYYSIPTGNPKNLTEPEIAARAEADDGGFMLFVEQSETTPTRGSREANIALADQGAAMAANHGAPPGTPLMFAVDTEARPYMDAVRGNFVLYRQRVPAEFPLWAYAGSHVIDQLIDDGTIEGGHIPAALSWSSTGQAVDNDTVFRHPQGFNYYLTPAASMLQYPSESYRGGRIDRNRVIGRKPVPLWYPGREAAPPQPSTGDKAMRWFVANNEDFPEFNDQDGGHHRGPNPDGSFPRGYLVFELVPGGKTHVTGGEWWQLGTSSLGDAVFKPGSPVQVGQLSWESTGWIQAMPNVPARGGTSARPQGVAIEQVPGLARVVY